MTVASEYEGDELIATLATEQTVDAAFTTNGVFQLWISNSPLVLGEELIVRAYGKIQSGSSEEKRGQWHFKNPQDTKFIETPPRANLHSLKYTIQQNGGTKRTFECNIVQLDA